MNYWLLHSLSYSIRTGISITDIVPVSELYLKLVELAIWSLFILYFKEGEMKESVGIRWMIYIGQCFGGGQ